MRDYNRGFTDAVELVRHLADEHLRGGKRDVTAFTLAFGRIEEAVRDHRIATLLEELGVR